ncbi:hypothetical protein AB0M46_38765 [Dactylosporangium sp. NPDC051485]|uniref:hypothetical protein n=1 Tax=Dactylosporangium sp. NPDC051485 TaxID=3154846 RepID=UPI003413B428
MQQKDRLHSDESARVAHGAMVEQLVKSIRGTDVTEVPFPHLIVDDILPVPVFDALVDDLPKPDSMPSAAEKGWASVAKYEGHRTSLFSELQVDNTGLWQAVEQALLDHEVEQAIIDRFLPWIPPSALERSLRREVRLDCTTAGAFFNPHTDHPASFMKQLIYLTPAEYDSSLDTLLYSPRDSARRLRELGPSQDFQADEYRHESPEAHREAGRVKHRPNRMFVFLRSVRSLHGFGPLQCSAPRYVIAVHRQFASPDDEAEAVKEPASELLKRGDESAPAGRIPRE